MEEQIIKKNDILFLTKNKQEIDIQLKQLEDLAKARKSRIIDEGYYDDDVVNTLYKKICERVKHENNK